MKFVHMADAHLGMEPEKGSPWSKERARELWDTFERILTLCKEEKVDLLLIAGDLFHRQPTISDIKEMRYLFRDLGRTRVVLAAGNHDYLSERSRLPELLAEGQIMLLDGGNPSALLLPSCNTTVYGLSYTTRNIPENPLSGIRPYRTKGYHILMAHGGDERNIPFDRNEFAQAGFDYVALGHIHKPERFGERMAYAGSPEPLDKTESGRHGVILGELKGAACHLDFVPVARREYVTLRTEVTPDSTLRSLCDAAMEEMERRGKDNFYRISLEGVRAADFSPDVEQLMQRLSRSGRVVELTDRTRPDFDFERLYRRNPENLMGLFIAEVRKLGLPEDRKRKVMEAGVEALFATADEKNFE